MVNAERRDMIEEEAWLIRDSGEIPEVAFHAALHYLADDPEGPGLVLTDAETDLLRRAVVDRFRFILWRDLDTDNRGKPLYRGLARAAANWRRLVVFQDRHNLAPDPEFAVRTAERLAALLEREMEDRAAGSGALNCPWTEVAAFAAELELAPERLVRFRPLWPEAADGVPDSRKRITPPVAV